ncbi:uncharacterized protein LOC109706121 isoform X3 [Ananas comosus]|uniref:Uncharacterized protein LOC109706121 isoform X3 n=1 Tax=Ananas comosus TaxID=4615 RepID=A0A6P5EMD8_ANACO|nr:uncharacterized protein LOC109706121 isoform X3 [Ananas comosus]
MEAPPQLLHCGVDPFRRSSALDLRALRGKFRPRPFLARSKGRGLGVFAIATEPKPGSAEPSSRVSINGAANRFGKMSEEIKKNEVARAIELREIVMSLGPAYIKLGQALSIRPDILSPAAMTELQKLCDKEKE